MAGTGQGATLTFSGNISFTVSPRSIGGLRQFVEILDDTNLSSTNYKESCPDDLIDTDPLEFEWYFDSSDDPAEPPVGTTGTLVLTFAPGGSSASSITGTGFISEWTSPEQNIGERTVASAQFKFDGKTEPAYSTGS